MYNPRDTYPDPRDITRPKVSCLLNFDITKPRDDKLFRATMSPADTDYFAIKSVRNGPKGIPFAKMISRDSSGSYLSPAAIGKKSAPHTESDANIDKILDKLSTVKRVVTPSFDLFKARYRKDQQLPSFMEGMNNRMSITGLSYEMLKANSYTEVDLAPPVSTFTTKKSFVNEKRKSIIDSSRSMSGCFNDYTPEKIERKQFQKASMTSQTKKNYFP